MGSFDSAEAPQNRKKARLVHSRFSFSFSLCSFSFLSLFSLLPLLFFPLVAFLSLHLITSPLPPSHFLFFLPQNSTPFTTCKRNVVVPTPNNDPLPNKSWTHCHSCTTRIEEGAVLLSFFSFLFFFSAVFLGNILIAFTLLFLSFFLGLIAFVLLFPCILFPFFFFSQ